MGNNSEKYMIKVRDLIVLNIIHGCFPEMTNFIHVETFCTLIFFRKFVSVNSSKNFISCNGFKLKKWFYNLM